MIAAAAICVLAVLSCAEDTFIPQDDGEVIERMPRLYTSDEDYIYCLARGTKGEILAGDRGFGATWHSGVIRSSDGGNTWEVFRSGLNEGRDVLDILVKSENRIFAALDRAGVFLSADGGRSWKQVNNHLTDIDVKDLEADTDGKVFALTPKCVFMTSDDGGVWEVFGPDSWGFGLRAFAVGVDGLIYAAGWRAVSFSEDGGDSWQEMNEGLEDLDSAIHEIEEVSSGAVILGTVNGSRVYRADGPGSPWTMTYSGGGDVGVIAEDPGGNIYVGTEGLLFSEDGGLSWERRDARIWHLDISSVAFVGEKVFAGARNDGLYISDDGGITWSVLGWNVGRIYTVAVDADGNIFAGRDRNMYMYDLEKGKWVPANAGNLYYHGESNFLNNRSMMAHPNGCVYYAGRGGVYVTCDRGCSWMRADTMSQIYPYSIDIDESGMIFVATDQGIIRSEDDGVSWETVFDGTWAYNSVSAQTDGTIYLAGENGLYRSLDYGVEWEQLVDSAHVYSVDADAEGNVCAAWDGTAYYSADRGESWDIFGFYASYEEPKTIILAPGGTVFIMTNYDRVYCAEVGQPEWTEIREGIGFEAEMVLGLDGYMYFYYYDIFRYREPVSAPWQAMGRMSQRSTER